MRTLRAGARVSLSLWLLGAMACRGYPAGTMVPVAPPHGWEPALADARRVKDDFFRRSPESPLLPEDLPTFDGLEYWAPDSHLYYLGPIHVHAEPEQFQMPTTSGGARPCERFGWIEFPVDGLPQRLEVYRLLDMGQGPTVASLLLPFADLTTGKETYPAGRYVDLEGPEGEIPIGRGADGKPLAHGPYVLDFNRAYNPSCAYGAPERFACPTTPPANRLRVAIHAGERGFKASPPAVAVAGGP